METVLVLLLFARLPHQAVSQDHANDDVHVVSALLTQTVRREVNKLLARPDGWRGSPLVVLLDRTIPMCPDKTGPWEECIDDLPVSAVRVPWWTEAMSRELRSRLRSRNVSAVAAPSVQLPNVLVAPYETVPGRRPNELYSNAAGWVSVSRPAYVESGKALVYLHFVCGALCCHGWFVLLESSPQGWIVAQEIGVHIC
jgi:hypothetical protein